MHVSSHAADLARDISRSLKLSIRALATSQLLVHRFYMSFDNSQMARPSSPWVSAACVLLSAKSCNLDISIRHVATSLHDRVCARVRDAKHVVIKGEVVRRPLQFFGADGVAWRVTIVETEGIILRTLQFRLLVELPHQFVLLFVNTLREKAGTSGWRSGRNDGWDGLLQRAWNFANDVMLSPVCATEGAEHVACGCILLAAREMGGLPKGWLTVFGSSDEIVERIGREIMAVYEIDGLGVKVFNDGACDILAAVCGEREANGSGNGMERQRKRRRFEDA